MNRPLILATAIALAAVSPAAGCGGDSIQTGSPDAGGVGSADGADDDDGPGSSEPLPKACANDAPCSGDVTCYSGVCVDEPPLGSKVQQSDPTDGHKVTGQQPNLDCVDAPPAAPDGPGTADMYGAVVRFGSGKITTHVQVDVYLASEWDASACADVAPTGQAACYRSYGDVESVGETGVAPIASTLSVPVGEVTLPADCDEDEDCPLGYECGGDDDDIARVCEEQFGVFVVDDVPTNTLLVVRSRATTHVTDWHDTFTFGVYLFADEVDAEGRYRYDVTMVSHGQWLLTANTMLIGDIPPQRGVIGGRVRDCRVPGIRDSWPIGEASLGLANPPSTFAYFNNLEDNTVPVVERVTTNILGRYAALDIEPGWNRIAGSIDAEGGLTTVGGIDVFVVPNALSIVSWPGLKPYWKQEWAGDFPD